MHRLDRVRPRGETRKEADDDDAAARTFVTFSREGASSAWAFSSASAALRYSSSLALA